MIDIPGMNQDPCEYHEAIAALLKVLAASNYADAEGAPDWLRPGDAGSRDGLYGKVSAALAHIAGPEFMQHLWDTSEAEFSLARRVQEAK